MLRENTKRFRRKLEISNVRRVQFNVLFFSETIKGTVRCMIVVECSTVLIEYELLKWSEKYYLNCTCEELKFFLN
jgi:hypothetical protein